MALTKIPGNLIETGAITGDVLADGGIATAKLANDAVTTDKVLDANITHAKLHATMDLTGKTVTVATATAGDNDTTVASTAFVSTAIANLADSAPATLDTLNELAAALGDDANFSTTVTNSIATKLPLAGGTLTGDLLIPGKIRHAGDTDTYISFANNDDFRVVVGNSTRATFNTSKIHFNQEGINQDFQVEGASVDNLLYVDASADKVGIGSTSPDQLLQVGSESYGANAIIKTQVDGSDVGNFDSGLHMRSHDDNFGGSIVLESRSGTNDIVNFKYHNNSSAGATAMAIDATNGNVGIGDVPSSNATGSMSPRLFVDNNLGDGTLGLQIASYHPSIVLSDKSSGLHNYIISHDGGHFSIGYEGGTAGSSNSFTSRLKILSSGNVGIGTSSPSTKLDVIGTTNQGATIYATQSGVTESLFLQQSRGTFASKSNSGNTDGVAIIGETYNSGSFQRQAEILFRNDGSTAGNGRLEFLTTTSGSSSEKMRITSTGNVGIGTTDPSSKLEVAGASGSSSTFKLSGRPDWTSGNGQYNVGNIYGENLGAGVNTTRIKLDGDDTSGSMRFYTANSGTLTSAMYLDNTQNATFYGSTTIPLGDRYYGQIKARSDMYVTSYGGGAGNTNKGLLVSGGNTNENSWVFIDSANQAWGIYHRNTDSTETYSSDEPLRPNSWAWVGGGRLSGYITLENKAGGGVTTQASYVRGGLAGVYHDYKFKSDSGFEIGKDNDGEPVHTPTINERSSATNAVDSTVGNGGPGVYWLNFNSKRFRAYVRPNWLQGRNWVLAAKWFSATDMPSGSAYWSNDDYHNEGDFNPYSGLWSKYLSWRYFSFNRLAMQMGDRIAPIMQFSSSQTLYGAFSGGRAANGGGVSPTSTDPALSTGAQYHGMTNYMGPNFTDLGGSEDKIQSYGLNKWANSSTNSGSANNNGSADLNSNVSQGFQLTVEDAHKNIGGIPSQGVAGAWIGCPLDEGNCNPLSVSSNGGADSGFGFGGGCGNSARTWTSGVAEWSQGNRVANYFPAYVWLSID